jgi:hypothetical protein
MVIDYNYEDIIPIRKGDNVEVEFYQKLLIGFFLLKLGIGFFLMKVVTKFSLLKNMLPIFIYQKWFYFWIRLGYLRTNLDRASYLSHHYFPS